jgi:transketolase
MRTAFIEQLIKEAESNKKIFLLVGDLGYSVVEPFAEKYPDRFLNVGIAEQNMTGVAAGLAMEGYNVFTYSIGNFPTLRCMEQIRYDVCYHNLSVKIVAVGAGYAYGSLGASHHTTEDIAMMRSIPNMEIISPCDPNEAKLATEYFCQSNKPGYLRIGKAGEPHLYGNNHAVLDIKKINCIKKGHSTAILGTGSILKTALDQKDFNGSIYSVPMIKPLDYDTLSEIANSYENIITIEEHQKSAGFGSAILEALNDLQWTNSATNMPKVKRIAIQDTFNSVAGSQDYLRQLAGLNLNKI